MYNLYKTKIAIIKTQDNVEAKINKRVRLDCTLSLIIFNTYIQEVITKIKENRKPGDKDMSEIKYVVLRWQHSINC